MSYTVKIYLDFEKIPDETYFTKEIFLAMRTDNATKLAVTMGLLAKQALDLETRAVILKTLNTIIENQKAILQGVASGQITFLNKSKGE
ncbi:TPA: hypothetical protein ACOOSL_001340 [Streptococcus pneumoniae]|uniref:Putative phage-related chromosomal island protein n=3 Tax=Streptococcus pneumoniae TaxID=1313 RepID=A0A098APF9_STREE|nr:hypothetical protein [Streptococcus pneumoniae]EHE05461.1 hypothetical protein SPAR49_2210 [Streptococcus pneumoniae GA17328]EHE52008.1 hypothetical protein SPAR145_2181 [Streptococcus pneumoniae NP127]EHY94956.1 hypothetical protein SPAR2_1955 [Streptococcus pneumoniae GA02270]EHY97213.1 hypothetical protein SPAR3_1407 [Streptococcus pneumoniae GA02714]QBX12937.1 hypothetical protein JavanS744_0010 [Streptococcus satellite phage Javan744]QBX12957.1 hypothetical protein JavanS745_0010 [Str